jgi:hypothetical protein
LQRVDDAFRVRVDVKQSRCKSFPSAQADSERAIAEPVDFLQERTISAAGEARRLFVDDSEGQQFGRFELRGVLRLFRSAMLLCRAAGHSTLPPSIMTPSRAAKDGIVLQDVAIKIDPMRRGAP